MQTVLIVIHLMIVIALVAVVLLQRSEGGGLGIGGGSGFMTGRGQANLLTRATAILAGCFFATSLLLSILAGYSATAPSLFDQTPSQTTPAPASSGNVIDQIQGQQPAPSTPPTPQVPQSQ